MVVRVRLFAVLRERAGAGEVELDLPEGARVGDALERLRDVAGDVPVVMAVNREYADADAPLSAGDELALVPPVSGGEAATAHVEITAEPLDLDALRRRVRDPRAGAVVCFEGVTRAVPHLVYEAYEEMARAAIARIVDEAVAEHGLCAAAVAHRVGEVPLSEPSVAIAVSAPHRAEAFAGARAIIDRLKEQVPIWKREPDGWVPGNVPRS